MSEDNFNLDSLLDDLDEAVKPSPNYSAQQTVRFMPHPPPSGRSPNLHNPKNKFAVDNSDSDRHSPSKLSNQPVSFHEIKQPAHITSSYNNSTGTSAFSPTNSSFDENSVDNLLDMMSSPPLATTKKNLTVMTADAKTTPSSGNSPSYSCKDSPPYRNNTGFDAPSRYSPKLPSSSPPAYDDFPTQMLPSKNLPSKNYSNNQSISSISSNNSGIAHQFGSGMNSSNYSNASNSSILPSSNNKSNNTSLYNFSSSTTPTPTNNINSFSNNNNSNSNTSMPMLGGSSKSHSTTNIPSASLWAPLENNNTGSNTTTAAASGGAKARCSRVVLGNAQISRGLKSSAFSKVCCDNLLCMACNFKIHYFPNKLWDESVDYMFLRNNVPNESKLRDKLLNSTNSGAYCCQCSSVNIDKNVSERQLTQGATGDPQWTCAGH